MVVERFSPKGPLFGPDFLLVEVTDENNHPFILHIYPDIANPELKAEGFATHYYYLPQRILLARKSNQPEVFDFGVTFFKALLSSNTHIGITDNFLEMGGGVCSFATTFAIPPSVIQKVVQQLKRQDFGEGMPKKPYKANFSEWFKIQQNDPEPRLGMVNILDNDVTIEVDPDVEGMESVRIHAQGQGKGSIEVSGISAFLVTLNQFAAGIVSRALREGRLPFTVHYRLKEQFYINKCVVTMIVNLQKIHGVFASFSVSGSIDSGLFESAYQKGLITGAINTKIVTDSGPLAEDDPLKRLIDTKIEKIMKRAYELIKNEIFDVTPISGAPAINDVGIANRLFGGASVRLKAKDEFRELELMDMFEINGPITILDRKAGTLSDLEPAIKADLDRYLTVIDIGEFFPKKKQIVAFMGERLDDTPIQSIQMTMGYPDSSNPIDVNGKPNLIFHSEGHIVQPNSQDGPRGLAIWTKDNPNDVIRISTLRLAKPLPNWDPDDAIIRKTIVFDGKDPRLDLKDGNASITVEEKTNNGVARITVLEVGHVFVNFITVPPITSKAISAMLSCTIGNRTDTIRIDKNNSNNVIWEIFSDKFFEETFFSYKVKVTAVSPKFNKPVLRWETPTPVKIDLPPGRLKRIEELDLELPLPSPEMASKIEEYIKAFDTNG